MKKRRRKRLYAVGPVRLGAEILKVNKKMEIGVIELMQKQMIQLQTIQRTVRKKPSMK